MDLLAHPDQSWNDGFSFAKEQNGLEKFRPYEKWLEMINERLRQRTPPVGEMG